MSTLAVHLSCKAAKAGETVCHFTGDWFPVIAVGIVLFLTLLCTANGADAAHRIERRLKGKS
jgi:hypothetical protein